MYANQSQMRGKVIHLITNPVRIRQSLPITAVILKLSDILKQTLENC